MDMYICKDNIKVCRVCLSTDVKLYNLMKNSLTEAFRDFSGIHISNTDKLPTYICTFCRHLLLKSLEFRSKCHEGQLLLQEQCSGGFPLTLPQISKLKPTLKLQLSTTEIENIDYCANVISEIEIKVENIDNINENINPIDYDNDKNDTINDNDSCDDIPFIKVENINYINENTNTIDNFNNESDNNDSSDDIPLIKIKNKCEKKSKSNVINDTSFNVTNDICESKPNETDEIEEFKKKYIGNPNYNQDFYNYILNEFLINENKSKKSDLNIEIEDSVFISIDNGEITENKLDLNERIKLLNPEDKNRKLFYNYIKEKYDKNNKEIKITDLTKMKVKYRTKSKEELSIFSKKYHVDVILPSLSEQKEEVLSRKETEKFQNAVFKCNDCYRGFAAEKAFYNHIAIHDPSAGPHICEICKLRFKTQGRLTKHIQLRHKFKFVCQICGQVTRNSTCASHHYKCHAGFKYECKHCGKVFSKYNSRMNHIRIFHGSVSCDICQETVSCETGLVAHKTKAHRELFKCTTCGVQFHNPNALKKHAESLPGGVCDPHVRPCTKCGDNFESEENLKAHMDRYHNKKRPIRTSTKRQKPKEERPNVRWLARKQPRNYIQPTNTTHSNLVHTTNSNTTVTNTENTALNTLNTTLLNSNSNILHTNNSNTNNFSIANTALNTMDITFLNNSNILQTNYANTNNTTVTNPALNTLNTTLLNNSSILHTTNGNTIVTTTKNTALNTLDSTLLNSNLNILRTGNEIITNTTIINTANSALNNTLLNNSSILHTTNGNTIVTNTENTALNTLESTLLNSNLNILHTTNEITSNTLINSYSNILHTTIANTNNTTSNTNILNTTIANTNNTTVKNTVNSALNTVNHTVLVTTDLDPNNIDTSNTNILNTTLSTGINANTTYTTNDIALTLNANTTNTQNNIPDTLNANTTKATIHTTITNRKDNVCRVRLVKKKKPLNSSVPQKLMCEMCAADGFASEAVLRYHQRIHTGEKPHPCPECPKRFRIRELLQKHLRTHTGVRPYKCAHCPKAFKTASAHYTHQVVHTKIRRHRCHLCEKTFLTSTCVKTHIRSVHMKIPNTSRARSQDYSDVMEY